MPKQTTNDAIVQRHKELRATMIQKHSKLAAEKIAKLKKPTQDQIAKIINDEFVSSQI